MLSELYLNFPEMEGSVIVHVFGLHSSDEWNHFQLFFPSSRKCRCPISWGLSSHQENKPQQALTLSALITALEAKLCHVSLLGPLGWESGEGRGGMDSAFPPYSRRANQSDKGFPRKQLADSYDRPGNLCTPSNRD